MICLIVVFFVVCNSFESFVFIFASQEWITLEFVQRYLRPIADLMIAINSGVNIGIYCYFNTDFRQKFTEMFVHCQYRENNWQTILKGQKQTPLKRPQICKDKPDVSSSLVNASENSTNVSELPTNVCDNSRKSFRWNKKLLRITYGVEFNLSFHNNVLQRFCIYLLKDASWSEKRLICTPILWLQITYVAKSIQFHYVYHAFKYFLLHVFQIF